ncbi:MAG: hypothetical protein ACE5HT_12670 [Gemmatimonadales bacterium]
MGPYLEGVFGYLFKYRPVVFERGDLVFGAPWPLILLVLVAVAIVLPPLITYGGMSAKLRRVDRALLTGLRIAVLAMLVFALLRPMLVVATVVPQQNFLAVLIDDSESMRIADDRGMPRNQLVTGLFGLAGSDVLTELADRFKLRFYGFSHSASQLGSVADLTYSGRMTNLSSALNRVSSELSSVPLAGIVLVTDGADNSSASLTESILQLRGRGVPVHAVGVGLEHFPKDIEITRVQAPKRVLRGSSVAVDVMIEQSGFGGKTVRLQVEDAGQIVSTQDVQLPRDGEVVTARVHFTASDPGTRMFRFRIVPQEGELVDRNNGRDALVTVADRREKILYFEGEPRFEVKFIRRAVEDDDNLQIVTLQQTADNKFYRIGVDDEDEIADGFPKRREDLFRYRGLILGSVKASFFTHDQLQMIAEFVSQRGGGLLTLGGRNSFSEGGWAGTPVADALPVVLEQKSPEDTARFFREVKVGLTPFGRGHPVTQIAATPEESEERWSQLPPLSILNPIRATKPGASTLLTGRGKGDTFIVLASQRYGKGRVMSLPVQDTWMWQMHADMPLDDMTHETFWRQILRWLINSVADPVSAAVSSEVTGVKQSVEVTTQVLDSAYLEVNDADVVATVTTPEGSEIAMPMEWTVERDGEYRASFVPETNGMYEVRIDATRDGVDLGSTTSYVQVAEPLVEYFDAEMHRSQLERVADETGGGFYTRETVAALPEDVRFTESGSTIQEHKDLWDMPAVFFLLLTLVGVEWSYRRSRGLV